MSWAEMVKTLLLEIIVPPGGFIERLSTEPCVCLERVRLPSRRSVSLLVSFPLCTGKVQKCNHILCCILTVVSHDCPAFIAATIQPPDYGTNILNGTNVCTGVPACACSFIYHMLSTKIRKMYFWKLRTWCQVLTTSKVWGLIHWFKVEVKTGFRL